MYIVHFHIPKPECPNCVRENMQREQPVICDRNNLVNYGKEGKLDGSFLRAPRQKPCLVFVSSVYAMYIMCMKNVCVCSTPSTFMEDC